MYGYEDQDGERGSLNRVAIGIAAAVAIGALGWFVVRPAMENDDPETVVPIDGSTIGTPPSSGGTSPPSSVPAATTVPDTPTPTTSGQGGDPGTTATPTTRDSQPARTTTTTDSPTTTTATTTLSTTTTTTSAPPESSTTTTSTSRPPQSYPTLPDGTPEPVVAIFDFDLITLTGNVPSQADKEQLQALADANSKFHPIEFDNQLTINPAVPKGIGARVVELTSTRFPESSSEILPEHALELDRVANVMKALPQVTALVIGHADQRGDPAVNYVLSEDRAQAVVSYLVSQGVEPSRLSARAVGEADLLSINDDDAALALNRRTEFILYGLLLG